MASLNQENKQIKNQVLQLETKAESRYGPS